LDDRVERARASVETALNELGLAVPSESTPGGQGQQQQGSSSDQQRQAGGDAEEAETIEGGRATGTSPGGKRPRWWIPEQLRPSPLAMEEDAASVSTPPASSGDSGNN
ncbi:unnamed protein product, partial [Ectocarpus fasciculatus]